MTQVLLLSHFDPSVFGKNTAIAFNTKQFSDVQLVVQGMFRLYNVHILPSKANGFQRGDILLPQGYHLQPLRVFQSIVFGRPDGVSSKLYHRTCEFIYVRVMSATKFNEQDDVDVKAFGAMMKYLYSLQFDVEEIEGSTNHLKKVLHPITL